MHVGSGEERSEDMVMMNTPVIKSALEMGFERSLVKQTVQSKILTSGENYKTVQELVSDLLSAEDQKREEEREMLAEAMASGTCGSCRSPSHHVLSYALSAPKPLQLKAPKLAVHAFHCAPGYGGNMVVFTPTL